MALRREGCLGGPGDAIDERCPSSSGSWGGKKRLSARCGCGCRTVNQYSNSAPPLEGARRVGRRGVGVQRGDPITRTLDASRLDLSRSRGRGYRRAKRERLQRGIPSSTVPHRKVIRRNAAMKVGMALNMLCQPGRPDASVVHEHMAMGDLVEPLGFDSLFALEHHFTGYAMSPAPLQLLAYYAGRTKRIHARHRGDRAALARSGACRGTDRVARHHVRRALPVRLRPRRRQRRNTRASASRWARPGRASSKRRRSSQQALAQESFEFHGEYFQIPRTVDPARGRSRTRSGASTAPRSARTRWT